MSTATAPRESGLEELLPLFVYGTLRRGECNHDRYLGGRFVSARIARLADHVRLLGSHGYFVIRPEPGAEVSGELFFLAPAISRETLEQCDRLEEIPPGTLRGDWYTRQIVEVETDDSRHRAWAYLESGAIG
jgi:gamma-glutamylcyclotransferase (GGCT)/AIG2-like uncharacterized protein YtfP